MLRSLVKKLKSQSLSSESSEEEGMPATQPQDCRNVSPVRKSARLQAQLNQSENQESVQPPSVHSQWKTGQSLIFSTAAKNNKRDDTTEEHDSGTESDDEELERIETTSTASAPVSQTSDYYASQQSLSLVSYRSQSPIHDTNSWDSMGCESAIVMRSESDTDSNLPTDSELLYQTNRQLTAFKRNSQEIVAVTDHSNTLYYNQGAFRPVSRRNQRESDSRLTTIFGSELLLEKQSPNLLNLGSPNTCYAGEKRKWTETKRLQFSQDDHKTNMNNYANALNDSGSLGPTRETLTAARRTPVRLLIPPPSEDLTRLLLSANFDCDRMSPSKSKRCKSDGDKPVGRPSLNFEKMRERMMKPGASRMSTKAKHWAVCSHNCQQWHCAQTDCMFRPVEPPINSEQSGGKTPTSDTAGFSGSN